MPTSTKTNVSVDVLNRIRESASVNYQTAVPIVTADADAIKEIGKIIIDSPNLQNEFINTLINRIGKVIISSKLFANPLSMFNKGEIEFGATIEEVFTDLCKPFQYSERKAEQNIYKRVLPNIKTAFHVVNSEIFYKQTVNEKMISRAFTSLDGVEKLVRDITAVMLSSANYDEYLMIKYLIAKSALDGTVTVQPIASIVDKATADNALTLFKEYSNNFEFPSTEYNIMGVHTSADKSAQYLIMNNHNEAFISVNALAYMFGAEYAKDESKKVRVDNFNKFDIERLKYLLKDADAEDFDDFEPFTADEIEALANIEAVLLDENFFQIYYQLIQTLTKYNEEGLNYNVWLHCWKVFSRSPFANVVIFASGTNGITALELDESTKPTVAHGVSGKATINADITFSGLLPKYSGVIDWSVVTSGNGTVSIDELGALSWGDDLSASDTITITAKSHVNGDISDTMTITVA